MAYGLTDEGFVIKRLSVIREEIQDRLKDLPAFGEGFILDPEEPMGQLIDLFAEREAALWELAQAGYTALNRDEAPGAALENLGNFIDFPKLEATYSTTPAAGLLCTGTPGTVIPSGSQVSQATTEDVYEIDEEVTIGGGGTITASVTALETGPKEALAGTLTVIETPVSGWTAVTNTVDVVPGRNIETDTEYRARQQESVAVVGSCTDDSLEGKIRELDDITAVLVVNRYQKTTDGTTGQPASSFWVILQVPDSSDLEQRQEIADLVFENKPAGIEPWGTTAVTVEDLEEEEQTVYLQYATPSNIWIRVIGVDLDGTEPDDWEDQVEAAILAYGSGLTIGDDVIYGRIWKAVYSVQGIIGADIYIGTSDPAGTQANITISIPAVAVFDSARITVTA